MKPDISDAIVALGFNGAFKIIDNKIAVWYRDDTQPTQSEIDTKLVSLISDWDAQEYARNRQAEYPSIADLVVALYDTDDKSAIETKRAEVKAKYPKPE